MPITHPFPSLLLLLLPSITASRLSDGLRISSSQRNPLFASRIFARSLPNFLANIMSSQLLYGYKSHSEFMSLALLFLLRRLDRVDAEYTHRLHFSQVLVSYTPLLSKASKTAIKLHHVLSSLFSKTLCWRTNVRPLPSFSEGRTVYQHMCSPHPLQKPIAST
jgi:hypothetical protein